MLDARHLFRTHIFAKGYNAAARFACNSWPTCLYQSSAVQQRSIFAQKTFRHVAS